MAQVSGKCALRLDLTTLQIDLCILVLGLLTTTWWSVSKIQLLSQSQRDPKGP